MPHMPATGVSGLDLYAFDDETERWLWVACTNRRNKKTRRFGFPVWNARHAFYCYLPLYNGVDALSIGVPEDAEFTAMSPQRTSRSFITARRSLTAAPLDRATAIRQCWIVA